MLLPSDAASRIVFRFLGNNLQIATLHGPAACNRPHSSVRWWQQAKNWSACVRWELQTKSSVRTVLNLNGQHLRDLYTESGQTLEGSFSAVSTATIARVGAFFRIFESFFEIYKICITLHRADLKISGKNSSEILSEWNIFIFIFIFIPAKIDEFCYSSAKFRWNLSEFHEKFQEITKVLNILRNSARKIRKMLEISGICEKFHFFEWKFQSTP